MRVMDYLAQVIDDEDERLFKATTLFSSVSFLAISTARLVEEGLIEGIIKEDEPVMAQN